MAKTGPDGPPPPEAATPDKDKEEPAPDGVGGDATQRRGEAADSAESASQRVGHFLDQILRSTAEAAGREVLLVHIDASSSGNTFTAPVEIGGDVVSGGQTRQGDRSAGPARPQTAVGSVDRAQLRKVLDVHIAVAGSDQARQLLEQHGVVILQGPPGVGKRTSALHLLLAGQVDTVLEIAPTLDLTELLRFGFQKNGRYLVDGLGPRHVERATSDELRQLGERVAKCEARLTITVNDPAGAAADRVDPNAHVVRWDELPDGRLALASHLRWYLEGAVPACDLDTICADEVVGQRVAAIRSASEVDRIARVLVRWARGEIDRDDARRRLPVQAAHEVEEWFAREDTDLADCARLITVAVLNGGSHRAVTAAADDLHTTLFQRERGAEAVLERSVFGATREQRLKRVHAAVVGGYERTEFGVSPVDVVLFDDESWQPAVLRHVWREYDAGRGCLVGWLCGLGKSRAFDVRVRVARAVGELAGFDFRHVCDEVIKPWAMDASDDVRDTAADALGVAAHGEAAPFVLNLLSHWATVSQRSLQWTAAASFGGPAGLRFPNLALDRLEAALAAVTEPGLQALAGSEDDKRVVDVVARSVRMLFERGREVPAYHREVLRALVRWTEYPQQSAMEVVTCFVFLNLALRGTSREAARWPDLLRAMDADAEARELALDLWFACFQVAQTRTEALDALGRWLVMADDGDLGEALTSAMVDIRQALSEYDQARVGPYLARITRSEPRTPAVERLLRTLGG